VLLQLDFLLLRLPLLLLSTLLLSSTISKKEEKEEDKTVVRIALNVISPCILLSPRD